MVEVWPGKFTENERAITFWDRIIFIIFSYTLIFIFKDKQGCNARNCVMNSVRSLWKDPAKAQVCVCVCVCEVYQNYLKT